MPSFVDRHAQSQAEELDMTIVALLALMFVAIDALVVMALTVEGTRRHLVGVHLDQELHREPRQPR